MAKVRYLNRKGEIIDQETYKSHRDDAVYSTVRLFDNGKVRVVLKWIGRVVNPQNSYPDLYKVFALYVENYTAAGTRVADPVDDDKGFPTESTAIAAYEAFLSTWTESHVNDDGVFEEVDNVLEMPVPPPPPKPPVAPDMPEAVADVPELGGVGAW